MREEARSREFERALHKAFRFLSFRPRTKAEMRNYLGRCGFREDLIEEVISDLEGRGYLNDLEFARMWKEERRRLNPRSSKLIAAELRRKGIDPEIALSATSDLDDEEEAYRLISRKLHLGGDPDFRTFLAKASSLLRRRGFDWGVIREAAKRAWREMGERREG